MGSFIEGIASGVLTTILVALGVMGYRSYRARRTFHRFYRIWCAFAKGPSRIVITGKKQGHTLKVSVNEREAGALIERLLPTHSQPKIIIAGEGPVTLQDFNVIALGSGRDNEITRTLLLSVSKFLNHEYTADNNLVVNGELFRSEYRDNTLVKDYALVCKARSPFLPSRKFLVFSGNHGIGTHGAVVAMTSPDPARRLLEQVGENDFYAVIETRIDKRFGVEPTEVSVVRCGFVGHGQTTDTRQTSREARFEEFVRSIGGDDSYMAHVTARARMAVLIARSIESRGIDLDVDAVYLGAMLHDIGRTAAQGISHGVAGAQIISKHRERLQSDFAVPPDTLRKVVESVECHIVGGLRREWIEEKQWELPVKDYRPESLEAKIVAFVDQLQHNWNSQQSVLLEAPEYDDQVYRQFYSLTKDVVLPMCAHNDPEEPSTGTEASSKENKMGK